ncbi:MAG: HNH endonuclease family protein [Actinobacteria bacterium]|nr:HNH endonuclease family protein [Actinomycetota bacterium]
MKSPLVIAALIAATLLIPEAASAVSVKKERATAIIETLAVKGRAAKTGYDRSSFSHWRDPDLNGCDARNDTLRRDLENLVIKTDSNGCKVLGGVLPDPYSGKNIDFVFGASLVDIDHVVALSNAWQTGAFQFTDEIRLQFANDPLNLLAVSASLNRQKGDGDAATWLPPTKSYRCQYVARQIAVKKKYGLWLTKPEKVAMSTLLAKCPKEEIPIA